MLETQLNIQRYLDCSLSHIYKQDMFWLQEMEYDPNAPLVVYKYEYGVFVVVPEHLMDGYTRAQIRNYGLSENIFTLLKAAHEQDCVFLRLDRDGAEYSELPRGDW